MRIFEVANAPHTYLGVVRVVLRDTIMIARTTIRADTTQQARAMLTRVYGVGNVLSVTQVVVGVDEMVEATTTLTPQELQVKSLVDKADVYKRQANAMKARQKLVKAQQDLQKAQKLRKL